MPTKYVTLDGVAVHVVHTGTSTLPDVPPALDRGATLVFLHGEGGSAPLWAGQLAHFAAAHSPLAIDLPGHGRSGGLDAPASVDEAAALVLAVLAALRAPPAVLVGHALGGQIALAAALARPAAVRGVVTIGTAAKAEIHEVEIEKLRNVVRGRIGQQFDTPFFGSAMDMTVMRSFWTEMVKTDPRARLGDLLAHRDSDLGPRLPAMRAPTLVVQGAEDRLCPCAGGRALAAAIAGARLVEIDGAGHLPHLEKPAEVNAAVESFLAGLGDAADGATARGAGR